jgi:subtilisin family serine protease
MTEHAAWLARILETHPDVVHVEGATETLIKRNELLVLDTHADAVHDKARRWVDSREDSAAPGVTRLRLVAGTDAADLTHTLRGGAKAHRRWSVTPNHVLSGAPAWGGGPYDRPIPDDEMPPPVDNDGGAQQVTIGILDTGVDPHPWFQDKPWYQACTEDQHEALNPAAELDMESESGHGTFIAGLLMQEAPGAYLRFERVLSPAGVTDEVELLNGLDRIRKRTQAAGRNLDILNLSLGCYTFDDRPSPVVTEAIAQVARHTLVVAAAGNFDSDRPYWPAALKDVVAVAALADSADGEPERASFSNYGWWVDAAAPGVKIKSTFPTQGREDGKDFHGYAKWSGTSFAAPVVAGRIAALMSSKTLPVRYAAMELLDPAGTRIPDLGVVVPAVFV